MEWDARRRRQSLDHYAGKRSGEVGDLDGIPAGTAKPWIPTAPGALTCSVPLETSQPGTDRAPKVSKLRPTQKQAATGGPVNPPLLFPRIPWQADRCTV